MAIPNRQIGWSQESNLIWEISRQLEQLIGVSSVTTTTTTTIAPYKVYTALLTQSGIDAPTAIILENTLGSVVWTYDSVGQYTCTLTGAFPVNKTFYDKNYQIISPASVDDSAAVFYSIVDVFRIYTTTSDLITPKDGVLTLTPIEIRVYN